MAVGILLVMGALAVAALVYWVLAIRLSYRIERIRNPDLPRPRLVMTNMFATAFWTGDAKPEEIPLQKQLRRLLAISVGCFIVLALLSFFLPLAAREEPTPAGADAAPAAPAVFHPTGTTLSYIRSNQDGSRPERILVHVVGPRELHVAKMVDACKDAAYVTANFSEPAPSPIATEAAGLVGGRLQRDGSQLPQAWVHLVTGEKRTLNVHLGAADAEPIVFDAPPAPWRVYDFDLAEFALFGPRETKDFMFGLALAWPEENAPLLRILGPAHARFLYASDKGAKNHYRVFGAAFEDARAGDRGGELITDATFGHVIEARFGLPNHPGYDNFMLKLVKVSPGEEGAAAWRDAITRHWQGCPS
jgi:hypothetical protein